MGIHSPRLRFKGVNVKSWEGSPQFLRVRMSCPPTQAPGQYLDLGSENYNGGTELLCICSMLCVCLQLLQCRILVLKSGLFTACLLLSPAILPALVCRSSVLPGAQDWVYLAWGMWRGTHQPLGHGTLLTGEPGVEPEGEGPKDYEINSKSWVFFDLPKCMYFILMKY